MSPKPRTSGQRSLMACTTCQTRRVKCVRNPGERCCEQCRRSNLECVIRPDGRRRPISRAEVDSLRSRLHSLEALLRSQNGSERSSISNVPSYPSDNQPGTAPPADLSLSNGQSGTAPPNSVAAHTLPNPSRRASSIDMASQDFNSSGLATTESHENYSDIGHGDYMQYNMASSLEKNPIASFIVFSPPHEHEELSSGSPESPLADIMCEGPSKSLIDCLTSSDHLIHYDPSSGRLRLSGPVIAFHRFSAMSRFHMTTNSREQNKRVEKILRELDITTHAYLMECFWSYYNPVMQVVNREIFEEDRRGGTTYSGLLHICILAMGYRYADASRPDIRKLALPNKESTLHREAKYLVEFEFEKPGGIPSVQALLILGQLESGSGRDSVGWTYAGVAFRSAIDIGLNLDCTTLKLSKKERESRSYVLRACTAFDRLWAIFLGRSTCIKNSDISSRTLSDLPQQLYKTNSQENTKSKDIIETLCFDALLDLLDLSAKIIELLYSGSRPGLLQHSDHLIIAGLDTDMKAWYNSLPGPLVWTEDNINTAPLPYFSLHSQYHASLVLLHRPFALYEYSKLNRDRNKDTVINGLASVSRAICIEHTFKMVQILTQQFKRFDPTKCPQTQLQHIGTALAALISATAVSKDIQERTKLLESLHILADLARAISPTYMSAEMISDVLDNLLKEPGWSYKQTAGMEPHLPKDFSQIPNQNDGSMKGSSPSAYRSQEGEPSLPILPDEFNFAFETDHGMGTLSSLREVRLRQQTSGSLASAPTALPSQQIHSHEELAQASYEPSAAWNLGINYEPGDLFDADYANMQFDPML